MHTVYYTGEFKPVERSARALDGVVDVWLRRNTRESIDDEGNEIKMADEIYLCFPVGEAPSVEELESNIDNYFEEDAKPKPTIDEVNKLLQIMLGVNA